LSASDAGVKAPDQFDGCVDPSTKVLPEQPDASLFVTAIVYLRVDPAFTVGFGGEMLTLGLAWVQGTAV
jgi:hypothetical protein